MDRIHSTTLILALTGLLGIPACADDDPEPMAEGGTSAGDEATSSAQDDSPTPTGDSEPSAEDESGDEPSTTGDQTTGEDETTGGPDVDELYDCEDPGAFFGPMNGPAFDPETGEFVGVPQDSFVAHTTLAVVSEEGMDDFLAVNDMVVAQLMQTPGVLGVAFAIEPQCGFLRTIGLWEDERSLYAFVGSGAHLQAMQQAPQLSLSGKTTHWELDSGAMPLTWDMAMTALEDVEPSPIYD